MCYVSNDIAGNRGAPSFASLTGGENLHFEARVNVTIATDYTQQRSFYPFKAELCRACVCFTSISVVFSFW